MTNEIITTAIQILGSLTSTLIVLWMFGIFGQEEGSRMESKPEPTTVKKPFNPTTEIRVAENGKKYVAYLNDGQVYYRGPQF